jgi:DNA (cytosine-5)-methyltransferase 1
MENKMHYNWKLSEANFTKDKGKVFSCFACGGGSTMGYKLAGFDVIGHNDIDPKMVEVYKENHKPKYSFLESITTFAKRKDLPKELYELDILDGSPPCSSFSMAGNREKDWGKVIEIITIFTLTVLILLTLRTVYWSYINQSLIWLVFFIFTK